MPRQRKDTRREQWMQTFEAALRTECERLDIPFPAGRIDWSSPTYHYGIGTPAETAALAYITLHLTPKQPTTR